MIGRWISASIIRRLSCGFSAHSYHRSKGPFSFITSPPTAPARPRYEVSSFRRHALGTMQAITRSGTDSSETIMRHVSLALATLIVASAGNTAFAQYDCPGGQRPVPPWVAERVALPLCGFDATKPGAGNMCQLCYSRNIYPNPFVAYRLPRGRYYELR